MKIDKVGSLEFVELDLMDMQKLGLMDLVACGSHCDRYCEDDGVWDLSCLKCALRYETARKVAERIATRLRKLGQEIPPREEYKHWSE
jgi:hypothetical protein